MESQSKLNLSDIFKITVIFTGMSAMVDTEENDENVEKVGMIIFETVTGELMKSVMGVMFDDDEEPDFGEMPEIDFDDPSVLAENTKWAKEQFKTLDKSLQIRVLSAVNKVLHMDGKFTEKESVFFNDLLNEYNLSVEELDQTYNINEGKQKLKELIKVTFVITAISASVDTEQTAENKEKLGMIVMETVMEDLMNFAFDNVSLGGEEFDFERAMDDSFLEELENNPDEVAQWCEEKFKTFDKETQIKIMAAAYKVLHMDGEFTDAESSFFDEILAEENISLEEVKAVADLKNDMSGVFNELVELGKRAEESEESSDNSDSNYAG